MARIGLTDTDRMDVGMGHTINAKAEDGSEFEVGPSTFTLADLQAIERGEVVKVYIDGIACEIYADDKEK